ncbi:hypothetical protein KKF84_00260 [Myxococcota bacterium]|nr:hypothetical protein [Myxococcota bacterium]MBU1533716.1 hypothetical protein [Myxococcota bacterium]
MSHFRCSKCDNLLIEGEKTCWNCAQKVTSTNVVDRKKLGDSEFDFDSGQFGDRQPARPAPESVEQRYSKPLGYTDDSNSQVSLAREEEAKRRMGVIRFVVILSVIIAAATVFILN